MLSEIWELAKALEAVGVPLEKTHPRVKHPGKTTGPCLRVRLRKDGSVGAVEAISDEEWSGLWTVRDGNQNSFPIVRLPQSLLNLPRGDDGWAQLGFNAQGKRRKNEAKKDHLLILQELWKKTEKTAVSTKIVDDWKRLSEKAAELKACGGIGNARGESALTEMGRRFLQFTEAANDAKLDAKEAKKELQKLLEEIGKASLQALGSGMLQGDSQIATEALLVGTSPPQSFKSDAKKKVQLVFDLCDDHQLPVRLYTLEVERHLISVLPRDREPEHIGKPVECSLAGSGQKSSRLTGSFSMVCLPVLNKDFPLFSMFKGDAKDAAGTCNGRYGLTDSMSVPVSESTDGLLADALKYITHKDRERYTWRGC